jgi:uncharacterized protein (TIGR02117 family)
MKVLIKKISKIIVYGLVLLLLFLGVYFLCAFVLSRMSVEKEVSANPEIPVYIKTNGVHTDIVVPIRNNQMDWSKEVLFSNTISKDTTYNYLAMGWGDKGFYLETPEWSDLKFSVAFKAAFALSTTAIHATFYKNLKEDSACKRMMISKEQYSRLIAYISNSFQKDADGHYMVINTKANYGNADAFYEANGRYNLFKTCNTWANNGLKASGQRCCLWTIFDTGIFSKYQ